MEHPEAGFDPEQRHDEGLRLPPWEVRASYGALNAAFLTVRRVLLTPTDFFLHMPSRVGLGQPLLFAVLAGGFAALCQWLWTLVGNSLFARLLGVAPDAQLVLAFLVLLFSPVLVTVGVVAAASLGHLVLVLTGGNRLDFEATYRVACYGTAAAVLAAFPLGGALVGAFWSLPVAILGLAAVHDTTPWRATVAVIVPMLVGLAVVGSSTLFAVLGVF